MTNLYPLNFKRGNRLRLMKQIRYYQPKKIASEKVSIWGVCVCGKPNLKIYQKNTNSTKCRRMIVIPLLQSSRKEEMEFEARLSQIVLNFVGKKEKK